LRSRARARPWPRSPSSASPTPGSAPRPATASRSHLRPAGEPNLLPRWRALTEIALDNRAPDPLSLERLSLPVPRLTLYTDGARLWTSSLRLERVAGEEAGVTVGPAPSVAPQRLSPPRQEGELSLVLRAFNSLFR
jgi:hypothetical protein